jgi:hypothetical protein
MRSFAKVAKMIGKLKCSGRYGMHFVTEVSTFWMKVLSLSCTPNMDTTASSEYLVPLFDTTRLPVPAADNTYRTQSSNIIESHVFEIILLVKVMLI